MKRTIALLITLWTVLSLCSGSVFAESVDWDDYEPEETSATAPVATTAPQTTFPATLTVPQPTYPEETLTTPQSEQSVSPVEPPLIRITRQDFPTPKHNEAFSIVILIQNYGGKASLKTGRLAVEPSDGLTLDEKTSSFMVSPLSTGDVGRVRVHLKVKDDVEAADQCLAVTYDYSYQTPEGIVQGQATEKLMIPVKPRAASETTTGKTANATPNIIVSSYQFGGRISAGDSFTLTLQFRNTSSKLSAENIVMSVETAEGLSITSASNTYYYDKLAAQGTQTQSIPMRVSPNADAQGGRIDISFKYEYVDGQTRSDASASERLSIPITIPDRFIVTQPEADLIGMQYEELSLSLPYVNKSRVDVSNVSAELIFDEEAVSCEQTRLNLGNLEPGKSGTIDFFFTPNTEGDGEVTVHLTYENEMSEEKSMDIRVPYSADPQVVMDDMGEFGEEDVPQEETGRQWILWVAIGGAAILVLVVVLVIVHLKKKKKKNAEGVEFNWDLPQSSEVSAHEDK